MRCYVKFCSHIWRTSILLCQKLRFYTISHILDMCFLQTMWPLCLLLDFTHECVVVCCLRMQNMHLSTSSEIKKQPVAISPIPFSIRGSCLIISHTKRADVVFCRLCDMYLAISDYTSICYVCKVLPGKRIQQENLWIVYLSSLIKRKRFKEVGYYVHYKKFQN